MDAAGAGAAAAAAGLAHAQAQAQAPGHSQAPQPRASSAQQQSMDEVGSSLERALSLLHQLHCTVTNFSASNQLLLLERLNGVQKELVVMQSAAQNCNIPIPLEVVRFIDDGHNPDEFTKDLLNSCVQRNQDTKGRVNHFKALRKSTLEEIEEAFPDEMEAYRQMRTQTATELRRSTQSTATLSNGDLKVKTEH